MRSMTLSNRASALPALLAILGLCGCGDDAPPPGETALRELSAIPTFAVVSTDAAYGSTSIAVLDELGDDIDDDWYNSGTSSPSLVAPLSGDVFLPTEQGDADTLTVLDRFGTNVVTRVHLPSGNLIAQQRTQGTAMDTSFSSNPTDYLWIDDQSAWIVRNGVNGGSGESPENQGNDVIEIDPSTGLFTGRRIDLASYRVDVGQAEDALALPSRAAFSGSHVVVGLTLAYFDPGFVNTTYAAGTVVVADLDTATSAAITLPSTPTNCANVAPVPGESDLVMIACAGDYFTESTMGIHTARVDAAGALTVAHSFIVPAMGPKSNSSVVSIDATHALALAFGNFDPATPDGLYMIDLTTGSQTLVLSAFGIGTAAYDASSGLLIVPTVERNLVRMRVNGDLSVTDLNDDLQLAPELSMSPRSVHFL